VGNETDAACVVFMGRVVQTADFGQYRARSLLYLCDAWRPPSNLCRPRYPTGRTVKFNGLTPIRAIRLSGWRTVRVQTAGAMPAPPWSEWGSQRIRKRGFARDAQRGGSSPQEERDGLLGLDQPNATIALATLIKPANVRADHVVAGRAELFRGFVGRGMDSRHDFVEFFLRKLENSGITASVLLHFQSRRRHTARIGGLARPVRDLSVEKTLTPSGVVGILAPSPTAMQPFLTSVLASLPLISFCVAEGIATWQGISKCLPPAMYFASL